MADRSNAGIVNRARSLLVAFWQVIEIYVDAKPGKFVAALARHSCFRPCCVIELTGPGSGHFRVFPGVCEFQAYSKGSDLRLDAKRVIP